MNWLTILYFLPYPLCGYCVARWLFPRRDTLTRLWLGGVFGLVLLIWLPALCAFCMGFTPAAQLIALIPLVLLGAAALRFGRKKQVCVTPFRPYLPVLAVLLPLFFVTAYLSFTHTIPCDDGALLCGQSTYGDLPMHLGFVTSIARQGVFPPQYSILPGTPVGYPFLCDSVSATFSVLGADLRFSMLLPMLYAELLVFLGVYAFVKACLKEQSMALLAVLLFFVGGGFGFAYFFDGAKADPQQFLRIFTGFYETPTNYTSHGIYWVNPIADMMIPQRATLFGWAILFPCLFFLRQAAFEGEHRLFLPLGVLAGSLPLIHTHSFAALGVISFVFLLRAMIFRQEKETLLGFLWYALLAAALSLPQLILFTFRQSGSFLQLHFNWSNEADGFLWFYIKNLGLQFLLLPAAFLHAPKKERAFFAGALVLWLLAELIQFQPNPYDNNKLLFVWYAFVCVLNARLLVDGYRALRRKSLRRYLAVVTCLLLFLSGVLTLGREWVSSYTLFSKEQTETAAYIDANTEADALFATGTHHNNAIASLSGRSILCGTGSYLYFHGLDYQDREEQVRQLYEQPEAFFPDLRQRYGIDFVVFSSHERLQFACQERYYLEQFPIFYQNGDIIIYDVRMI